MPPLRPYRSKRDGFREISTMNWHVREGCRTLMRRIADYPHLRHNQRLSDGTFPLSDVGRQRVRQRCDCLPNDH
jgi:hypothetical protein